MGIRSLERALIHFYLLCDFNRSLIILYTWKHINNAYFKGSFLKINIFKSRTCITEIFDKLQYKSIKYCRVHTSNLKLGACSCMLGKCSTILQFKTIQHLFFCLYTVNPMVSAQNWFEGSPHFLYGYQNFQIFKSLK